ncbi:NAD-dependent epimerase/dehydratase family protein [Streptomyces sp. AC627_RSS907]|uniref:NAD-dependent epimerase/dehydratase family protein n=1 Tax=Streptomyces sp. AC627_RSS907 TaxID=2823684 RepID=UPI001C20FA1A|nr:NAD-dependent epimerase/dehydratase family protein [Streptomyces sp. AC627_RSS907]
MRTGSCASFSSFVGQHLIRRSRSEGHDVVALARSAASPRKLTDAEAEPVRGDLIELPHGDSTAPPARLEYLLGVDAVAHAAARMEFRSTAPMPAVPNAARCPV